MFDGASTGTPTHGGDGETNQREQGRASTLGVIPEGGGQEGKLRVGLQTRGPIDGEVCKETIKWKSQVAYAERRISRPCIGGI